MLSCRPQAEARQTFHTHVVVIDEKITLFNASTRDEKLQFLPRMHGSCGPGDPPPDRLARDGACCSSRRLQQSFLKARKRLDVAWRFERTGERKREKEGEGSKNFSSSSSSCLSVALV